MAAAAPLNTPARRPFGAISGARLRNLGNVKNKQNALATSSTSTSSLLKPSQSQFFDDIDSENIDPSLFASSSTSSKNLQSLSDPKSSSSSSNMQHFKLATSILSKAPAARTLQLASAAGQKRKASEVVDFKVAASDRPIKAICSKREVPTFATPKPFVATPPTPIPAPAGRSPKSKRAGILSRRRVSARVDPPTSGVKNHGLPSIDAALSGTLPSYNAKAKPSVMDYVPMGWRFQIHEDTLMEHDSNMMEHSTSFLDLSSDDESNVKARDDRGKENIPPADAINAPIHTSAPSRNDLMTDDVRSPLGVLNAADYYSAGCDANSYFIVPADTSLDPIAEKSNIDGAEPLTMANIDAVAAASDASIANTDSPIEIWESESAKAEQEVVA